MAWKNIGNGTINKAEEGAKGAPYWGKCKLTIDGKEREINIGAWLKPGNNGSKFFSLAFSVKEDQQQHSAPAKQDDGNFF